ncbi:unnamed protein product [Linum trigynum]|uniref:Uncharacterized protein n=1 Tax=Linum trigynum TaxID=586398 RepID=A0AAV2E7V6_9ROSI
MIIKRNLKLLMARLERCKLEVAGREPDNTSVLFQKKRKLGDDGYCPLNFLGQVTNDIIPIGFHGILGGGHR